MPDASPLRIAVDQQTHVATLTLANPARRNALSEEMLTALSDALTAIARDRAVRAIVLAAEGPAFCAGHDLRELDTHRGDPDGGRAYFTDILGRCSTLMQMIVSLPLPVIAAVEGIATAAGCQLVASCDIAYAGDDARFCTPGVDIGLFCSTPAVALTRVVHRKAAMEMLLSGEAINPQRAEQIGLINRAVPREQALPRALVIARRIAARSAEAIAFGKPALAAQTGQTLEDAYAIASAAMVENMLAGDAKEGINAFLTRRPPQWSGL